MGTAPSAADRPDVGGAGGASSRLVVWAMAGLAALLLLPAFLYSIRTEFALVDDMADWQVVSGWISHPGLFLGWCRETWLTFSPGRYRPLFELNTLGAWVLWGPRPGWHHAARWGLKLLALTGFLASLRLAVGRDRAPWAALLLAYLFLFIPNQPDARLAPQEMGTVFFLAWLNLVVARLHTAHTSNLAAVRGGWLAGLYLACLGLSWAKETNVAVLAWVTLWFLGWSAAHRSWRALWRTLPVALLTLYTVMRVATAARSAEYGVNAFTWVSWRGNLAWLGRELLQTGTSWGIALPLILLLCGLVVSMLRRRPCPQAADGYALFVWGELAGLLLMVSVSWLQVLRYWYPLVPLLALLVALALSRLHGALTARRPVYAEWLGGGCFLFVAYFVVCNLHAFYAQYAVQEHVRTVEQAVKTDIGARLSDGAYIFVHADQADPNWEFIQSLKLYFSDYLPATTGAELSLAVSPPPAGQAGYFLTRTPWAGEGTLVCTYAKVWPSRFMAWTYDLSAAAQRRRPLPVTIDAGASSPVTYGWYLYHIRP
ncbi:MAG: hypothetical protein HN919_10005 [Verrucomicrobia bacterium]|jgi:hypothetical protein|nr:hypothetical protein [Verrucomicrobiota bacterium]MBT7066624.1 hypothetical protein [Verrucomicrobiota bacterium]MBT7699750.1 hypothetical protein [Verrucomicrobiota bacterium]